MDPSWKCPSTAWPSPDHVSVMARVSPAQGQRLGALEEEEEEVAARPSHCHQHLPLGWGCSLPPGTPPQPTCNVRRNQSWEGDWPGGSTRSCGGISSMEIPPPAGPWSSPLPPPQPHHHSLCAEIQSLSYKNSPLVSKGSLKEEGQESPGATAVQKSGEPAQEGWDRRPGAVTSWRRRRWTGL